MLLTPLIIMAEPGYTVNVRISVSETGRVEAVEIISSEAEMLNGLAEKIAREMRPPVRQKDGVAIKYQAVVPLDFPVEGDGGVTAQEKAAHPGLRKGQPPTYPFAQARAGEAGGALLELSINEKGRVTEAKTVRATHKNFGEAARTAALKWVFEPAIQNGAPVATRLFQAFVFKTNGQSPDWRWHLAPRPCLPLFESSGSYIKVSANN